jgi:hypothetical protein
MIARNRAMDFHRASRDTVEVEENTAVAKPANRTAHEVLDFIRQLPDTLSRDAGLEIRRRHDRPEIACEPD